MRNQGDHKPGVRALLLGLTLIFTLGALPGCGGGSGDGGGDNWDEMQWDEGEWQ